MSLVDHQAPPIFKRGPAPVGRLLLLVSISLVLLVTDLRFRYLEMLRQGLSVVTYPLQMIAAKPMDFVSNSSLYFATLVQVQQDNAKLRDMQLSAGERLLRFEQLEAENAHLRALLAMSERVKVKSLAAEVLYSAPDPFSRKVILDRGAQQGIEEGLAVVDESGLIGQVTRIYPIQSEVTLITDRNQAIPVQVSRNGLRSVLSGAGQGVLELRFVVTNMDIQPGDRLVTSGLDGVFVPGLPVAEVVSVNRDEGAFARVVCRPLANVESSVQVLVLGRQVFPEPVLMPTAASAPVVQVRGR